MWTAILIIVAIIVITIMNLISVTLGYYLGAIRNRNDGEYGQD